MWRRRGGIRSLGAVWRAAGGRRPGWTLPPIGTGLGMCNRLRLTPLLVLLAGAGVFASCQGGGAEVNETGACSSDDDCVGATCYDGRFCVQTPAHESEVVLSIQPSADSGLVLEQFVTTVGGPEHDQVRKWDLTPAAVVHGTISRGALAGSVPGAVLASSPGILAGTVMNYEANSYTSKKFKVSAPKEDAEAGDKSYGFQLRVQPGRAYDVLFWPQIDAIPPYYTNRFAGGGNDLWLVELPDEDHLVAVSGRIVAGPWTDPNCDEPPKAASCGADCAGVAELQVRLVDAQGRLRSTRTRTDKDGYFVVHVDPSAAEVWLKFRAHDADRSLPHGTWAQAIDLASVQLKALTKHDLGLMHLGDLPAASAMVEMRPRVVDADGSPVVGARLTVNRAMSIPQRCGQNDGQSKLSPTLSELFYSRTGLTDGAGHVKIARENKTLAGETEVAYEETFKMPPGVAVATVLPPALAATASWRGEVTVTSTQTKVVKIPCPRRPIVRGAVTDFRGRPIVAATVLFKPLLASKPLCPAAQSSAFPRPEAPIVAQADDSGVYLAHLDPGRYAVLVNPPQGSGLARALLKVFDLCPVDPTVNRATTAATNLDLTVPPPTLLQGRIHSPSRQPVVGAVVDVLASQLTKLLPPADGRKAATPERQMNQAQMVLDTQVIGTALTDGQGRYEVLIAAGQLAAKE